MVAVERFKNRFLHPTFNGYRDGLFNLRMKLPDGRYHIVELQIHLLDIIKFKAATHKYYGMLHCQPAWPFKPCNSFSLPRLFTFVEYFRSYFAGNLDVVGERMELLERIVHTGGGNIDDVVANALIDGDKGRLLAIGDLLEKMSELEMLQRVREKLVGLARSTHGEESAEFATNINDLALTLKKQVSI